MLSLPLCGKISKSVLTFPPCLVSKLADCILFVWMLGTLVSALLLLAMLGVAVGLGGGDGGTLHSRHAALGCYLFSIFIFIFVVLTITTGGHVT